MKHYHPRARSVTSTSLKDHHGYRATHSSLFCRVWETGKDGKLPSPSFDEKMLKGLLDDAVARHVFWRYRAEKPSYHIDG